jgi:protein-S-isoprenylcysteine O-methyltransferase Ste14
MLASEPVSPLTVDMILAGRRVHKILVIGQFLIDWLTKTPQAIPKIIEEEPTTNPTRFLMRVPVPWVFVLAYLVGVGLESLRPIIIGPAAAQVSTVIGAMLFAVGAATAGWALTIFRRARTTTVPGKRSSALVTWGPYRMTRNPMYVGLILAYIGEAGLLKQIWPLVPLTLVVAYLNWTVIPIEEARLKEAFHDDYEQYRATVRRWL